MSIFTHNINYSEQYENKDSNKIEHYVNKEVNDNMDKYIKKKNDTLDRKIVMTNNYAIINQNHIQLLKYFLYVLIIMNIMYIGITFHIIPKILASMVLSILSIIFLFVMIIIILKNKRLYKINMEEKYYPKHNPYNLLHYFKKQSTCDQPSAYNITNTKLDTLEDIIKKTKQIAIQFDKFQVAKQSNDELKLINDHKHENAPYGPYKNDDEIYSEIVIHTTKINNLKDAIINEQKLQITNLTLKSQEYKKKMEESLLSIKQDKEDKQTYRLTYNENQYKFNEIIKNINDLEKKIKSI